MGGYKYTGGRFTKNRPLFLSETEILQEGISGIINGKRQLNFYEPFDAQFPFALRAQQDYVLLGACCFLYIINHIRSPPYGFWFKTIQT